MTKKGTSVPSHEYWTDDVLAYAGKSSGNCSASMTGTACPTNQPMHVCGASVDAEGNGCTWTGCGLNGTADEYFGGCSSLNNATAGALCCAD